jgi:Cu+-exporting ATPase
MIPPGKDCPHLLGYKGLQLKLVSSVILSIIIFFGSMQHLFSLLHDIDRQTMLYAMFVLTAPAVFWVGSRFFIGALKAARQETSDMNTLVAVTLFSHFFYVGYMMLLALQCIAIPFKVEAVVMPHVYYDGAAMIVALILLDRVLEVKTKYKTSNVIKNF